MLFKRRSIHASQPTDTPRPGLPTQYAVDELYKCPNCYFVATFGVPISPEEYARLHEEWNGHRIEDYAILEKGDEEIVRERLRALGYIA